MNAKGTVDFVCVGGNKCGTTWLYEMLRQHPQINASTNKEPHYFSQNYHCGEEWYWKNWRRKSGIKGEFSTSYLYSEKAAQRLAADFPAVRILVMLRHPLDRAVSHLRHVMRSGEYASWEQALNERPEVVQNSLYADRVRRLEEAFGADDVLVCFFDTIKHAPRTLMQRIFSFLGVDPDFEPEKLNEVVGKGYKPRVSFLERFRLGTYRLLKRNGLYEVIRFIKSTGVAKRYKQLNARADDSTDDRTEARERLRSHSNAFCADLRALVQLSCVEETKHPERWAESLCNASL